MDWNPIGGQMPDEGVDVLLRSKNEQYYIGTYHSNAGVFRFISRYKLQEDGSILGLTTGFHESYFTHWAEITLPTAVTLVTADQIPFNSADVKAYLDRVIRYWRGKKAGGDSIADYYIDAFQSVRTSLFGETLPLDDTEPPEVIQYG